jgi:hypothetical protein
MYWPCDYNILNFLRELPEKNNNQSGDADDNHHIHKNLSPRVVSLNWHHTFKLFYFPCVNCLLRKATLRQCKILH